MSKNIIDSRIDQSIFEILSTQTFQLTYKKILNRFPDMVWIKDLNGTYIYANRALCKGLLMCSQKEAVGGNDIFFASREKNTHPNDPNWHTFGEMCTNSDFEVLKAKKPMKFLENGYVKGKMMHLEVHKAPFYNEYGVIIGTVGIGRDVSEIIKMKEKLHCLAFTDPLTALNNRHSLEAFIESSMTFYAQTGIYSGFLLLNFNNFRKINDEHGHIIGDLFLKQVAQKMLAFSKQYNAKIVHYAGDDFIFIFDNLSINKKIAKKILFNRAKKLQFEAQSEICISDQFKKNIQARCSIGAYIIDDVHIDSNWIVSSLNFALKEAKSNCNELHTIVFYKDKFRSNFLHNIQKEKEIAQGFAKKEFVLFYQPQYKRTNSGYELCGVEGLMRWKKEDKLLPPDSFIPIAERSGQILRIGEIAIEQAVDTLMLWQEKDEFRNISVSINISSSHFESEGFLPFVFRILEQYHFNTSLLHFEITESNAIKNKADTIQKMQILY
ncbi:MAG: EAL domain-containing protein, partial [Campylobacterales bacterium]|nr:EAL domain-containing protein [Campylobacterales bacterium]